MWLAPLGFVTTVVAAQVVSRAARRRRPDGAGDGVGAELLSPCFPAALRGRRHRLKEPALTVRAAATFSVAPIPQRRLCCQSRSVGSSSSL